MLDALYKPSALPTPESSGIELQEVAGSRRLFDSADRWFFIGAHICVAGGAYPILLTLIGLIIGFVSTVWAALAGRPYSLDPSGMLIVLPIMVVLFGAFLGVLGMMWTAVVSLLVVPLFRLFARSLQLEASDIWHGAGCGGLVGFVAVLPIALLALADVHGNVGNTMLVLAIGPGLTTILGQLGGAWGGWRLQNYIATETQVNVPIAERSTDANPSVSVDEGPTEASQPFRLLRFRIHHLLWIFVWTSVVLAVFRLLRVPLELLIPLSLGWLVYQTATLYCGWWIARRFWKRRAAAASRST